MGGTDQVLNAVAIDTAHRRGGSEREGERKKEIYRSFCLLTERPSGVIFGTQFFSRQKIAPKFIDVLRFWKPASNPCNNHWIVLDRLHYLFQVVDCVFGNKKRFGFKFWSKPHSFVQDLINFWAINHQMVNFLN